MEITPNMFAHESRMLLAFIDESVGKKADQQIIERLLAKVFMSGMKRYAWLHVPCFGHETETAKIEVTLKKACEEVMVEAGLKYAPNDPNAPNDQNKKMTYFALEIDVHSKRIILLESSNEDQAATDWQKGEEILSRTIEQEVTNIVELTQEQFVKKQVPTDSM